MGLTTNYKNSAGVDIGSTLVEKSYLTDRYPELANTFRFAGLWNWGRNSEGQLGDGSSTVHRSSPIQTVSGGTNWKLVAGSGVNTVAIKTDGTLWLWGINSPDGTLGNGATVHRSSPVQTVAGGTNWKSVGRGASHTVAISSIT
jgi:alpha-tubulin suppressor-like RCC1 family protein